VAPPRPNDYVELRCRSAFSFLEAASNPEDLVARAAELDYPALALADRGGLYGAPRFHRAAAAAGLRALVGAEIRIEESAPDPAGARNACGDLLLLAETPRGYRNLSRLLTCGHARGGKQEARVSWQELEEHAADLTALARGDAVLTPALLDRARALLPKRRVWVDVCRPLTRAGERAGRRAAALAEAARVPLVASNDVRHARPEDRRLLDALTCLRWKTSLDAAGRRLAPNAERHLRPRHEMLERFADRPEWTRATREIAERCTFTLGHLGYRFPEFPTPPGETQGSFLRSLTARGARERYGTPLPRRARQQLERELALIEKLDLAGYFLIVHDIARFARAQGILAQGRGSAANSAVCYALGITAVDPVAMELLFERFLSEQRGEWPDIDIDLPSGEPRERVIQYVFEKYGERGAAMTAVVVTYRTRLALREMGKVLGIEPDAVDRLARLIGSLEHRGDRGEFDTVLRQAGVDPTAPRSATLLELTQAVRGLPRHLGQHTGGIVIAAGRLDEVVPIEPARMAKRRVVQWDKDDCADLGIIKIDLLGLGMLAALEDTIQLVRAHEDADVDLAHLPPDDPQTYAMIRAADTIGTFQIESRAQMATLPRMRPERFYDLVVEVAIIRPGPITGKMVHPYLERRAGRAPVTYPHPCLEPILERTLGVPLFQEQLLRIAMAAAGFSGGEAEELRRAMGFKRSVERMSRIERRLVEGMLARGISEKAREEILRGITSFALYGFPESHAASFALIAYASAYLKCHHPAAFLAGLLNAQPMGFYGPATLVKDAQRHGVEVRPIDPAHSDWHCTLEPQTPAQRESQPAVRLGLRHVSGLRAQAGRVIAAERRRAPFASAADLARRAGLRRAELEALAELGALAGLDPAARSRRSALWQVAALERDPRSLLAGVSPAGTASPKGAQRAASTRAAGARSEPQASGVEWTGERSRTISPLPEMSALEATLADYRLSGLTLGPHLLEHLRPELERRGVLSAVRLRDVPNGCFVRTAGHAIVRQRPGTAKGFCFLTLEDETGTSNAVLTPREFHRFRAPLHAAAIVEIAGPLQKADGVIHVRVRELRPLVARSELPDSHDYR
jgi:error-prone DNA polymerase